MPARRLNNPAGCQTTRAARGERGRLVTRQIAIRASKSASSSRHDNARRRRTDVGTTTVAVQSPSRLVGVMVISARGVIAIVAAGWSARHRLLKPDPDAQPWHMKTIDTSLVPRGARNIFEESSRGRRPFFNLQPVFQWRYVVSSHSRRTRTWHMSPLTITEDLRTHVDASPPRRAYTGTLACRGAARAGSQRPPGAEFAALRGRPGNVPASLIDRDSYGGVTIGALIP